MRALRQRPWLVPALGVLLTVAAYVLSAPFPGGTAGLYLQASEAVVEHGFGLPRRIPGYTAGGVPLVYPPLAFYLVAALLRLGVDGLTVATYLPGVATVLAVYPAYRLGVELETERVGLLFASFLFLTPSFVETKLLANGITRGPAALLTLTGLVFAARMYRTGGKRDTAVAGVCFGAVALTHPRWVLVAGVSYVGLFLRSPTRRGFLRGAATALIGGGVAAPWLLTAVARHGVDPFLLASKTRGGILNPRYVLFASPVGFSGDASIYVWSVTTLGGVYALATERWYLVAWAGLTALIAGTVSGVFVPLSLLAAVFAGESFVPAVTEAVDLPPRTVGRAVVALLILPGLLWTPMWMTNTVPGDRTTVTYHLSEADVAAMAWVADNTAADATFVVADGPIDWFPYVTDRTILVSTFGTEWFGPAYQERQLAIQLALIRCSTLDCIAGTLDDHGIEPDYVYVAADQVDPGAVDERPAWRVAFANEAVVLLQRRPQAATRQNRPAGRPSVVDDPGQVLVDEFDQ